MSPVSRRSFLRGAGAGALTLAGVPAAARALGAPVGSGLGVSLKSSADPSLLPTPEQILEQVRAMVSLGPRLTGTPAHNAWIDRLEQHWTEAGVTVSRDHFKFTRWLADRWSLEVLDGPGAGRVPISTYFPYTAPTTPAGVTAPMVYGGPVPLPSISVNSLDLLTDRWALKRWRQELATNLQAQLAAVPGGVSGKIILLEAPVPPLAAGDFTPFVTYTCEPNEVKALTDIWNDYKRIWIVGAFIQYVLEAVEQLGPVGALFALDASAQNAVGQYTPYAQPMFSIPAVYVDRDTGTQLRKLAQGTPKVNLVLTADVAPTTPSDSLVGILPGDGSTDEVIILNSHTDGQNAFEENGGIALTAMARYFQALGPAARRRTLVFSAFTGHFGPGLPQAQGFVDNHPDLIKRAAASVTVEHFGATEWLDNARGYYPTGQMEIGAAWHCARRHRGAAGRVAASQFVLPNLGAAPDRRLHGRRGRTVPPRGCSDDLLHRRAELPRRPGSEQPHRQARHELVRNGAALVRRRRPAAGQAAQGRARGRRHRRVCERRRPPDADADPVRRVALLVLACATAVVVPSAAAQAIPGCNPNLPVVAHHPGGAAAQLPAGDSLPVACATQTGYPTSETTLAVTPAGTLIFSPAQTENSMARSTDDGASWTLTTPKDEQPTGFWNTVDPDVIADPRTGRVFWSHATGPVRDETGLPQINSLPQGAGFYLAAAQGFQVHGSSDDGLTWTTADYSTAPTGDWDKLAVGPPPPADTGAAQPTGYPDVVYMCANSPLEVTGPGRLCYKSLDGGVTFQIAGYVSPSTSEPHDVCPPLNFDPPVVDSTGAIYQPVTCDNGDYVAISHDEGSTYSWVKVPGAPTGNPDSGPYLQLAVDAADNLYGLWQQGGLIYLIVSRDRGQTWSAPMMIAAPGVSNVTLPALSAGAAGNVAITYYASTDPNAQLQTAYITQTADALDPQPLFYSGAINDPSHPIFHDYGLTDAPRADFVGGAFDAVGRSFWAGVVKQLGPPDSNENIPTTGYVGTLEFEASTPASLP